MGRKAISYEAFKTAWADLEAQQKATIDNVRAIIGGSNPTLMKYRDQYRSEQHETTLATFALPDDLQRAIYAFAEKRSQVVMNQKADLESDLAGYRQVLDEKETAMQEKTANWQQAREVYEQRMLGFEKQLSAAEARLKDVAAREQKLEKEIEGLHRRCHASELKTAVAETRNQEYEKYIKQLETESDRVKALLAKQPS